MDWKDYQEEAAEFFRSLGLDAENNVTLQGVRTKHDIDVLVRSHHVGFDVTKGPEGSAPDMRQIIKLRGRW